MNINNEPSVKISEPLKAEEIPTFINNSQIKSIRNLLKDYDNNFLEAEEFLNCIDQILDFEVTDSHIGVCEYDGKTIHMHVFPIPQPIDVLGNQVH